MRRVPILLLAALLVACGAQPAIQAATPQGPTAAGLSAQAAGPNAAPTPTGVPAQAAAPTTPPTPPPAPRWFWAISEGKKEVLAFNAEGQVNPVLDVSGIKLNSTVLVLRMSEDQAVAFLANNDNPRAFLLTSNSATPIKLPGVQAPVPGSGWEILAQYHPYIVVSPAGDATSPAILINGQNGQSSLVATDVLGPDYISYFVRFSADGRSLRFATAASLSDSPIEIHNRNLQTGKDTVFFQTSSYIVTDAFGEIWSDTANGKAQTAEGQPVQLKNTGDATYNIPLDNGWILDTKVDCAQPCALQAYPSAGNAAALNYSLPVKLVNGSIGIYGAQLLDQNRLLVSVYGDQKSSLLTSLWLLTPDGKSELLGKGFGFQNGSTPLNRLPGSSADGRYILYYPASDKPALGIYDLTKGSALFSETLDQPDALLQVTYLPEGILVLEQGNVTRQWVYDFATGSAAEIKPPAGTGTCTAITPDGKPICMTKDSVVVYDPASGAGTPLIQEQVTNLSN